MESTPKFTPLELELKKRLESEKGFVIIVKKGRLSIVIEIPSCIEDETIDFKLAYIEELIQESTAESPIDITEAVILFREINPVEA